MYSVWQKTGGGVSVSGSVRTVNELIVSKCAKYRVHTNEISFDKWALNCFDRMSSAYLLSTWGIWSYIPTLRLVQI